MRRTGVVCSANLTRAAARRYPRRARPIRKAQNSRLVVLSENRSIKGCFKSRPAPAMIRQKISLGEQAWRGPSPYNCSAVRSSLRDVEKARALLSVRGSCWISSRASPPHSTCSSIACCCRVYVSPASNTEIRAS